MAEKKRKAGKKRSSKPTRTERKNEKIIESVTSVLSEPCVPNQYEDNVALDERENVDLLETIDGIEYERDQFHQDFPNLAAELDNANLNYPMDAVRWEDEGCKEEDLPNLGDLNIESLLRRSKNEQEATEIVKYLEKREEITHHEASKILAILKTKGLKAFQK